MRRSRRFAVARDGTRIAWTSAGAGAPPVVLTDGIGCAGWIWTRLSPELARERRVIHWNYRGHGASGVPADPERITLQECARDLVTVLDAARVERAVLVGHSMGVQVVLDAWRRAPRRVAGLVLVCGAPGRVLDTFHESTALRTALPLARRLVDRWPELARAGFRALVTADVALDYALAFEVNRALLCRDDLLPYFEDLSKVDPALFVRLLASAADHDATPWLPDVDVPTLVVAGARDAFTPMRLSVAMSQAIRGSEVLVLPGGTHVGPLEHPELLAARVRAFLAARVPVAPPRSRARRPAARAGAPRRRAARGTRA
ncbi:MAG TPA: alpha/beta hydrolase [Anaeromyxobacter sp.]|nr:alpha/beta hydrolase [Anaeromyxobacter sp.]